MTNLGNDVKSAWMKVLMGVFRLLGPLVAIPFDEAGERQLFFATSARFAPRDGVVVGVPLVEGVEVARGTDGKGGSGVYSISEDGESAGEGVERLLKGYREDGTLEKVWEGTEKEFTRICGHAEV